MEQKFDLKDNSLLNFLSDTPVDENIILRTIFTQKYPTVNFSQTTVSYYCSMIPLLYDVSFVQIYS